MTRNISIDVYKSQMKTDQETCHLQIE